MFSIEIETEQVPGIFFFVLLFGVILFVMVKAVALQIKSTQAYLASARFPTTDHAAKNTRISMRLLQASLFVAPLVGAVLLLIELRYPTTPAPMSMEVAKGWADAWVPHPDRPLFAVYLYPIYWLPFLLSVVLCAFPPYKKEHLQNRAWNMCFSGLFLLVLYVAGAGLIYFMSRLLG